MAYLVTAALVSIKDPAGKNTYFYQGATVPDGFDKDDIDRLVQVSMLEAVEAEAKPAARSGK